MGTDLRGPLPPFPPPLNSRDAREMRGGSAPHLPPSGAYCRAAEAATMRPSPSVLPTG